jgi:hypothetical protein
MDQTLNMPWVDSPFFERELEEARLDPARAELARSYATDGYVLLDSGLSAADMDAIIRDLDGRYRPGPGRVYADERRIQDAWLFSAAVRRAAVLPGVLDTLSFLYRRRPIPFQTLNFRVGSEQRTHSDTIHFNCFPQRFMCGVWIALEDIDADNGPLRYFPGSHKLPIWDLHDLGVIASRQRDTYENYVRYEDFIEKLLATRGDAFVEVRLKRGQALIWSANLLHGGSPIRDPKRSRHSQVTHFYFENSLYYTPLLSDPAIGRIAMRKIVDITTGNPVPQAYNGVPVQNPGGWPPILDRSMRDSIGIWAQRARGLVETAYGSLRRR